MTSSLAQKVSKDQIISWVRRNPPMVSLTRSTV